MYYYYYYYYIYLYFVSMKDLSVHQFQRPLFLLMYYSVAILVRAQKAASDAPGVDSLLLSPPIDILFVLTFCLFL